MKQQNKTTAAKYEVTPRTGLFVEAMKAIAAAEQAVYDAMAEMYGEENTLFSEIPFHDVKKAVAEYMYLSMAENMEDSHGTTTTI